MAKPFSQLRKQLSPEAQKIALAKTQQILAEMQLHELRQTRQFSQERMAAILHTKQANISRMERRADMYISTLRNFIEAMGGQLEIIAHFPEGGIRVNQF